MRRVLALICGLAFTFAFGLAPFQHVHHDGTSTLIHAHFGAHSHNHVDKPGEREIEADEDGQVSSLDTFTPVTPVNFVPFVPVCTAGIVPLPVETRASFALIEECGHDPPGLRLSPPRAPPA
jgi:hypothetical protein